MLCIRSRKYWQLEEEAMEDEQLRSFLLSNLEMKDEWVCNFS